VANVATVLVLLLLIWGVVAILRRSHGVVARRGLSVGADLGSLADKPRVRVRAVTKAGPDRVRLILTPEPGPADGPGHTTSPDLEFVVFLREEQSGFELLNEWKRSEGSLAIVLPPDSRLVRLRSIDGLQPLTLRRVDEG
jgi:hypothetical protein